MKLIVKLDPDAPPPAASVAGYGLSIAALIAEDPGLNTAPRSTYRWGSFLASAAIHIAVITAIVASGQLFPGLSDEAALAEALEESERERPRMIVLDLSSPFLAPALEKSDDAGGNEPGPKNDAGGLKSPKAAEPAGTAGGAQGDGARTVARFTVPNLPKPTPGARQTFLLPDSNLQVADEPLPTLPNLVVRSPVSPALPKFEYERFSFTAEPDAPTPESTAVVSTQSAPVLDAPAVQGGEIDFATNKVTPLQPLPPERFRMPLQGQESSAPAGVKALQASAPIPSLIAQNPNPAPLGGLVVLPGMNQLAEFHTSDETNGPGSGRPTNLALVTSAGGDSDGATGEGGGTSPGQASEPGSGSGLTAGLGSGSGAAGTGSGAGGNNGPGQGLGDGQSTMAVSLGGGGTGTGRGSGDASGLSGSGGGNGQGSGSGQGSGAGSGLGNGSGSGTGTGGIGSGLGSTLGDAARYIEVKMLHPETGKHDIVVVQASGEGAIPDSGGILDGKPVYTVYLDVGAPKAWILQYAVPSPRETAANQMVVQLGNPAPVVAPYPMVTYLPRVDEDGREGYVMLHGFLAISGRLEELRLIRGGKSDLEKVLVPILKEWEFRPASRDGLPVRVEVLVAIPPYKV